MEEQPDHVPDRQSETSYYFSPQPSPYRQLPNNTLHHQQYSITEHPPPPPPQTHTHPNYYYNKPQEEYGTEIVQIQTDQVYRVSPLRNPSATHNQRHGDGDHGQNPSKRSRPSICVSFLWVVIFFIGLSTVIIIVLCIFYLALKPRGPRYSIENMSLNKNRELPAGSNDPSYDVSVKGKNPNAHIGIYYLYGGRATLSFSDKDIATGQPPAFYHSKKNTTVFHLLLTTNEALPEETRERLELDNSSVQLELKIHVRVKLKVWKMMLWRMKLKIKCRITVVNLAQEPQVVSQHCMHYFDL